MKHLPNILTVLRLSLIPAFLIVFFLVSPLAALPLFLLAGTTDVLDGYLARKNGWVSVFGKVADPIADKLMQGAVLIALMIKQLLPWYLVLPFFLKEISQGVLSIAMLRQRQVHTVSFWYGKVAICIFYLVVTLSIVFLPHLEQTAIYAMLIGLWILTLIIMVFTFVSYVVRYARMAAQIKKNSKGVADTGE